MSDDFSKIICHKCKKPFWAHNYKTQSSSIDDLTEEQLKNRVTPEISIIFECLSDPLEDNKKT